MADKAVELGNKSVLATVQECGVTRPCGKSLYGGRYWDRTSGPCRV